MIGNSVVPGLPKRCVMPSSFSKARNAERPVMRFFIRLLLCARARAAAVDLAGSRHQTKLETLRQWPAIMAALRASIQGHARFLDGPRLLCNQSVTCHGSK